MNRNAKGAIAAGAAVLLLLGGAGTFALWNQSADLNTTDTISSGQLHLSNVPVGGYSGAWYFYEEGLPLTDYAASGLEVDVDTYLVVPEDELIYVIDGVELEAEGGDLYFTLGSSLDGEAAVNGYSVSTELLETTTPSAVLGATIPAGTTPGTDTFSNGSPIAAGTPVYHVDSNDPGGVQATLSAGIVVSFDADDLDFQDIEDGFSLGDVDLVLQQVVLLES